MKTFELICRCLAVWAIFEGVLIGILPEKMRNLTLQLFPKAASFLNGLSDQQFRGYGLMEASFGLLLGIYFFFIA